MASRTGAKPGIGGSWAVKGKGSVCIMKCFREVKWDEEQKQVTGAGSYEVTGDDSERPIYVYCWGRVERIEAKFYWVKE